MKPFFKQAFSYFLQGLLLVTPLAITIYILIELIVLIDGLIPFDLFPGAGLLIIFVLLSLLGLLGNTIIFRPIKAAFQQLLNRAPLIKTIYQSISDLLTAFVGQKKKFSQPVIVILSDESNLQRLGFVTQDDLSILGISKEKVAVYLPHSYNFSGNVFIVDSKNVKPINAKSSDVMKFIVSGGVSSFDEDDEKDLTV
ncbi:DUF502 domain-containing protein [Salibacter halophilus]|jgi:uncharacterized membrane protein|uniref:DUF502 domain-containing protein n=1 Tax=Salibacter halophilus TaxID=1803916 RepID=A0A6N6M5V5_9FLAO|nr:DUF502 domain-containing protein [Salibacter halophilus]KAB1063743.1 DUF502 domain-containing protein [Salibacter halophilus]